MRNSGHVWATPDLSRCELCGDKDWMADKFCAGNPDVAEDREAWLEGLKQIEQPGERAAY